MHTNNGGTIQSTNYPDNYNNNEDIEIPIEVAYGSRVKLTFTDFDVEFHHSCSYDWVQIQDTDGSLLGDGPSKKFCGNTLPPTITSSGNKMTVIFHSDLDVTTKGFQVFGRDYLISN